MTHVVPSSTSRISLIPGPTFHSKTTKNGSIKCFNLKRSTRRTLYAQDCVLPLTTSLRLFPHVRTFGKPRFVVTLATGVDVDVAIERTDQSDSPVSDQDSAQTSEPTSTVDKSKQRSRPVRKSEMPPVKDEELIPGASFTGKVRSIKPFGAFIDFGAFTDGLLHVSLLSDGYVKDVANVVSVGQEVKVKLVKANIQAGRIRLTMRETLTEPSSSGESTRPPRKTGQKSNAKSTKAFTDGLLHVSLLSNGYVKDVANVVSVGQEVKVKLVKANIQTGRMQLTMRETEPASSGESTRPPRKTGQKSNAKSTKFVKRQDLEGTVKNLTRSGAFINLPEVTLTMKKDEDNNALDSKLQGKVFTATNPFLVAFRQNKDIASFLDKRDEKVKPVSEEEVKPEIVSSEQLDSPVAEKNIIEDEDVKIESVGETEITSLEPEEDEKVKPISEEEIKLVSEEEIKLVSEEEFKREIVSSEQLDAPVVEEKIIEDEEVKIEPVSVENSSIASEEQVEIPEEASRITSSSEQARMLKLNPLVAFRVKSK